VTACAGCGIAVVRPTGQDAVLAAAQVRIPTLRLAPKSFINLMFGDMTIARNAVAELEK
jgi:hypothetical protein